MIETIVYLFCAIVTIGCAVLLLKSYFQTRSKLVFWGAIFFICFALSNVLLFFDLGIMPAVNLSPYRDGLTLAGLVAMVFGLIKGGGQA